MCSANRLEVVLLLTDLTLYSISWTIFSFGETSSVHTKSKVVFHSYLYCSLHFYAALLSYVSPCSSGWASCHAFESKCLRSVRPLLKILPTSMTWICISISMSHSQSFGLSAQVFSHHTFYQSYIHHLLSLKRVVYAVVVSSSSGRIFKKTSTPHSVFI